MARPARTLDQENYEEAATLRDQIRHAEQTPGETDSE